jgi:hypothetical protein
MRANLSNEFKALSGKRGREHARLHLRGAAACHVQVDSYWDARQLACRVAAMQAHMRLHSGACAGVQPQQRFLQALCLTFVILTKVRQSHEVPHVPPCM